MSLTLEEIARITEASYERRIQQERRLAQLDRCEHGWVYMACMPCGCPERRQ